MDNTNSYGKLIASIRKDKKINQKALCQGMCDKSMFHRIEMGSRRVGFFSRRRFMSRLGLSLELFTEYLQYDEYELFSLHRDIILAFENEEVESIESTLDKFEEKVKKDKAGIQFALFCRSIICSNYDAQAAFKIIGECVRITMPDVSFANISDFILSSEEVCYLSYYLQMLESSGVSVAEDKICANMSIEECFFDLLEYIGNQKWDISSQVRILPSVLTQYWHYIQNNEDVETIKGDSVKCQTILMFLEQAINLVKRKELLFYLPALLKIGKSVASGDRQKEYEKYDNVFRRIYEMCECDYDREYPWSVFYGGGVYLLGDVLKKRRKMLNITQKDYCEGVCDVRTYSRTETGKAKMHDLEMKKLLEKAKLYQTYSRAQIISDDYSLIKKAQIVNDLINERKYIDARKEILELKEKLDLSIQINQQFIGFNEAVISTRLKEIGTEGFIDRVTKCLKLTLDYECLYNMDIVEMYFTSSELYILFCLIRMKKTENELFDKMLLYFTGDDYFNQKLRNKNYSKIVFWFADYLGNNREMEKSSAISRRLLKQDFLYMRRSDIVSNIYNILWNKYEGNFAGSKEASEIISLLLQLGYFYNCTEDIEFFANRLIDCNTGESASTLTL